MLVLLVKVAQSIRRFSANIIFFVMQCRTQCHQGSAIAKLAERSGRRLTNFPIFIMQRINNIGHEFCRMDLRQHAYGFAANRRFIIFE